MHEIKYIILDIPYSNRKTKAVLILERGGVREASLQIMKKSEEVDFFNWRKKFQLCFYDTKGK